MHRFLALCATLMLVACQSSEEWPSLAYRPGEGRPLACGGQANLEGPAAPAAIPAPAPPAPAPVDTGALAGQARDICASLDLLDRQWESAARQAETAVALADKAAAGSPQWGAAQIALSQLEKFGSAIGEQQRRADDLVQIISRAGLRTTDEGADANKAQEKNVVYILETATRAGEAMARHNSRFAALSARLAPAE